MRLILLAVATYFAIAAVSGSTAAAFLTIVFAYMAGARTRST